MSCCCRVSRPREAFLGLQTDPPPKCALQNVSNQFPADNYKLQQKPTSLDISTIREAQLLIHIRNHCQNIARPQYAKCVTWLEFIVVMMCVTLCAICTCLQNVYLCAKCVARRCGSNTQLSWFAKSAHACGLNERLVIVDCRRSYAEAARLSWLLMNFCEGVMSNHLLQRLRIF